MEWAVFVWMSICFHWRSRGHDRAREQTAHSQKTLFCRQQKLVKGGKMTCGWISRVFSPTFSPSVASQMFRATQPQPHASPSKLHCWSVAQPNSHVFGAVEPKHPFTITPIPSYLVMSCLVMSYDSHHVSHVFGAVEHRFDDFWVKCEDVRILRQPNSHETEWPASRLFHHGHDRLQDFSGIPRIEHKSTVRP